MSLNLNCNFYLHIQFVKRKNPENRMIFEVLITFESYFAEKEEQAPTFSIHIKSY